ncbi:uncharacterized protein VP01_2812g4 [Puccinia sorghi]|uniref:Transcription factor Pcc1 n=1 Tax=Puccinia sorghi TaxID=27349 RepID=A0A0L6V2F9_9BASI|nr:uncharacterized protein VP01_2812g4 [Puccinia sorghi]
MPADWHVLERESRTLEVPVPTEEQAETIVRTISPDKPVKSPHFIRRSIHILSDPPLLPRIRITIAALTLRQARVSMDHLLSDLELVVETIAAFSPPSP